MLCLCLLCGKAYGLCMHASSAPTCGWHVSDMEKPMGSAFAANSMPCYWTGPAMNCSLHAWKCPWAVATVFFLFNPLHPQVYGLLFGDILDLVWLPVTAAGLVDLAFGLLACGTAVSMGNGGPSDTTVVGIMVLARPESCCHGWISPANLAPG